MDNKKTLILFDVDGTIAESSKKASDAILIILAMKKTNNYQYGLISGGSYTKLSEQVGQMNIKNTKKDPLFNYVFCENGMIGYKNDKVFFKRQLIDIYENKKIIEIENFILNTVSKNFNIYSDSQGKLERRNSLWYFTLCGVFCNDEVRNEFIKLDNKDHIRMKIIKILKDDLLMKYNLEIKLGGNIGLAISPKGWDKSYIIKNKIITKEDYSNIYFFGDKCTPDGNDYPLYNHPDINGIDVKDPNDTLTKIENWNFL
jgi:phosphomannomutase